jgi:haloacetate dehalogenase
VVSDPISVWRDWAADIPAGLPITSDHHIADEAPEEVAAAISAFLMSETASAN